MTTLTDFLLARIAEDEAVARDAHYEGQRWLPEEEAVLTGPDLEPSFYLDRKRDASHAARWSPARVLAECEAKRLAIEAAWGDHLRIESEWGHGHGQARLEQEGDYPEVVFILTAIYKDHPDYQPEWSA